MGNMRVADVNLVEVEDPSLIVTSEDSVYNRDYLRDGSVIFPFRFTGKENEYIIVGFSQQVSVSCVAILGHNFTPNVQLTLRASNRIDMSNPLLDLTLSWHEKNIYACFDEISCMYVRLTVNDPDNASVPEIRELFIGKYVELSQNFSWNYKDKDIYKSIVDKSEYGQCWVYELFNAKQFMLPFKVVNDETCEQLLDLFRSVKGEAKPFVFIPDSNRDDCYFVRFGQSVFAGDVSSYSVNSTEIVLTEEPQGVVLQ